MRRSSYALLPACSLFLAACGDAALPTATPEAAGYRATIRRTSYGIPHINADDYGSLGFGVGFAGAQDFVCTLADQIVKVRSERAKYFGPGDKAQNVDSDFLYLAVGATATAPDFLAKQSDAVRQLVTGYAAGYDHYLEVTGVDALPPACKGAAWVKPITVLDLAAYYVDLTLRGSTIPLGSYLVNAGPPSTKSGSPAPGGVPHLGGDSHLGSNGWAIGSERSAGGQGMLVANPHFPWEGELRFYESHLTIPGVMNVYGASLTGVAMINIGFNADVGWTHTVTPSKHFTVYELTLTPGNPLSYTYGGMERPITKKDQTIQVRQPDGSTTPLTRTFYSSHFGPMVEGPGLGWTATKAYSVRDANATNQTIGEQWLRMDQAKSVAEIESISEEVHGIPWVYTIASDKGGNAMLVDSSRVPNLSPATVAKYQKALGSGGLTKLLANNGVVLLDGSDPSNEWVEDEAGGVVPVKDAPRLVRTDFAMNANDSPWLTNPAAPLTGTPLLYGEARQPPTARTHMNLAMLTDTSATGPAGADGKFTLDELADAVLADRGWVAESLRAGVVARCKGVPSVVVGGKSVDITAACAALEAWNGRVELDQAGAIVWRELLGAVSFADSYDKGKLFANAFDPDKPLTTPNTLVPAPAMGPDPILVALGTAVVALKSAGFDATTTLGKAQLTKKGDKTIPIHGGLELEGVTNVTDLRLGRQHALAEDVAPGAAERQHRPHHRGLRRELRLQHRDGARVHALGAARQGAALVQRVDRSGVPALRRSDRAVLAEGLAPGALRGERHRRGSRAHRHRGDRPPLSPATGPPRSA